MTAQLQGHKGQYLAERPPFALVRKLSYNFYHIGLWRSLAARTLGVREVGGSNPLSPIRCCPYGVRDVIPTGCDPRSIAMLSLRGAILDRSGEEFVPVCATVAGLRKTPLGAKML